MNMPCLHCISCGSVQTFVFGEAFQDVLRVAGVSVKPQSRPGISGSDALVSLEDIKTYRNISKHIEMVFRSGNTTRKLCTLRKCPEAQALLQRWYSLLHC